MNRATDRPIAAAWYQKARELAEWVLTHLVNRRDGYGHYIALDRRDGQSAFTDKRTLTPADLARHFRGRSQGDILGLHASVRTEAGETLSRWGGIDIDKHDDQVDVDPQANARYALTLYARCRELGLSVLLLDSNGNGGFHLVIVFDQPAPTETVYRFLHWLKRDWRDFVAKDPETFPKQPALKEGEWGNWLRLPGRHHTRDHWSRVWDGAAWLDGADAVAELLATEGTPASAIPAEALTLDEPEPEPEPTADPARNGHPEANGQPRKERRERQPGELTPGDDFNERGDWGKILTPHGWAKSKTRPDNVECWARPGKNGATSATLGFKGDLLYVFTDQAAPLVQGESYSKFSAYTVLNHKGDYSAAARALAAEGYGTRKGRKKFHTTDLGNAERLVARYGRDLRFCHPWKQWLVWDGRRWDIDKTGAARQQARRTARGIYKEAEAETDDDQRKKLIQWGLASEQRDRISALLSLAEAESGIPILPDDMDRDPWSFNCLNGTVDLRTGTLRPHRREDLITKICPVVYDPQAECPLWEGTLRLFFAENEDLIGFWRRVCGYALVGVIRDHVMPIAYGKGENGKSTILGALLDVMGPDYAMKCMPDLLMAKQHENHPTDRADLFGKRLVVAIETEAGHRLNETMVKELTGGDRIRARRMRENSWEFSPTHTVIMATNHKPRIRGTDNGIWRRLRLVPFGVSVAGKQADKSMPEKLRGERSGILAWCVRGCLEWRARGLDEPQDVTDATGDYRKEQDRVGAFLDECTVSHPAAKVRSGALFACYKKWATDGNESALNQKAFSETLEEREIQKKHNNGIWWHGIGLRSEHEGRESGEL